MKEIITLGFGTQSNNIMTHFFNLNNELFNSDQNDLDLYYYKFVLDNGTPRALLFDCQTNTNNFNNQDYYEKEEQNNIQNDIIEEEDESDNAMIKYDEEINDENSKSFKITKLQMNSKDNKLQLLTRNKQAFKKYLEKENMTSNEFFDTLDLNENISTWVDYIQFPVNKRLINSIKTIDIPENTTSYLTGVQFLSDSSYNSTIYFEEYEDKIRYLLETSDLLDKIMFSIDVNSMFGGVCTSLISEYISNETKKKDKVMFTSVDNSEFYLFNDLTKNCDVLDLETYTNQLFYFSDLFELDETIVMSLFNSNNPYTNNIYRYNENDNGGYKIFQSTSLPALDIFNLTLPSREYKKTVYDPILNNKIFNNLNFIGINSFINNHLPLNDPKKKKIDADVDLNWIYYTNNFQNKETLNSKLTIDKYLKELKNKPNNYFGIFQSNHDNYYATSKLEFDKYFKNSYFTGLNVKLPICYPRYYKSNKKEETSLYSEELSTYSVVAQDTYYATEIIKKIPIIYSKNKSKVENYLKKIDTNYYVELQDRMEYIYKVYENYDIYAFSDDEGSDHDI